MELVLKPYDITWIQANMDLNFISPSNKNALLEVVFQDSSMIKYFNPSECRFTSLEYTFANCSYNFDLVYSLLVEKAVSKEIELHGEFDFYPPEIVRVFKHENSVKFHECFFGPLEDHLPSNFKEFVLKYMTDDGIIKSREKIFNSKNIYEGNMYIFSVCDIIDEL